MERVLRLLFIRLSILLCVQFLSPCFARSMMQPLLVDVVINQKLIPNVIQCYDDHHKIWLRAEDLQLLRLTLPKQEPKYYLGKLYYQLNWYPHLHYHMDYHLLRLTIHALATHFIASTFTESTLTVPALRPWVPGGFINYDITAIRNAYHPGGDVSALMELGFFNRFGVGISHFLFYKNHYYYYPFRNHRYRMIRLDTNWTLDQPENMATWRFGDSISGANSWSNSVHFAGVQYSTNFNTQPYFITFPLPRYRGEAVVPSNVDIFINHVLAQSRKIGSGPFILNDIPAVTGAGTINVVVRDLLGRSQLISLPYYTSPILLKSGLNSFSYEAGSIRDYYSIEGYHYGRLLAIGTYYRGISNQLTVGMHGELLKRQQTIGLASHYLYGNYGIVSLALAGSRYQQNFGWLTSAGFTRNALNISYGITTAISSRRFLMLGELSQEVSKLMGQVFVSYNTHYWGSLGVNYTVIRNLFLSHGLHYPYLRYSTNFLTATYSYSLFKNMSMSLSGVNDFSRTGNNQIFASITVDLDGTHILNTYLTAQQHEKMGSALELTKSLPLGNGYGYRLAATTHADHYFSGHFSLKNDIGLYSIKVYGAPKYYNYEASASGGIIYFNHSMALSRSVTSSFALVHIPHYSNIPVYYQNQVIAKTGKNGQAFIPALLPYQKNELVINPKDFPLNAQLTVTKQTVVPYLRSGTFAHFDVRSLNSVLLRLTTSTGALVPPGSIVILSGGETAVAYVVGYDGIVYFPNLSQSHIEGVAQWEKSSCRFNVTIPTAWKITIHDLGIVRCF